MGLPDFRPAKTPYKKYDRTSVIYPINSATETLIKNYDGVGQVLNGVLFIKENGADIDGNIMTKILVDGIVIQFITLYSHAHYFGLSSDSPLILVRYDNPDIVFFQIRPDLPFNNNFQLSITTYTVSPIKVRLDLILGVY